VIDIFVLFDELMIIVFDKVRGVVVWVLVWLLLFVFGGVVLFMVLVICIW